MKYLIAPALFVLLTACSVPSPEEQKIAEYEQTIFDTKVDLKFNVIKLDYLGEQKAIDSLNIIFMKYQKDLNTNYPDYAVFYDSLKATLKKAKPSVHLMDSVLENGSPTVVRILRNNQQNYNQYLQLKEMCNDLEMIIAQMDPYIEIPEQVITHKYQCQYSIENPLLNNAKQEITKTYYFDPKKEVIIAAN